MQSPSAKPHGSQRFMRQGYEKRDANAKWIFGVIAFLLVAGLIMHSCLAGILERLNKKAISQERWVGMRRDSLTVMTNRTIPHLQLMPPEDLKKFREQEETELNTYGWINRTDGIVRIPVERAMELVLQRGFPVWSETNANGLGLSSYQLQQERLQFASPEKK